MLRYDQAVFSSWRPHCCGALSFRELGFALNVLGRPVPTVFYALCLISALLSGLCNMGFVTNLTCNGCSSNVLAGFFDVQVQVLLFGVLSARLPFSLAAIAACRLSDGVIRSRQSPFCPVR